MKTEGLVIVGGGMAAYALAREFRKLDRETPVTVVTADDGAVYAKPLLSNAMAMGKTPDALVQRTAAAAAAELGIGIRTATRATRIDRAARRIDAVSADGPTSIPYARLALATGADPRSYRAPGSDEVPVATVNGLDDYRRWRGRLGKGERVLLIGAGLIGVEFANDLAAAGYPTTVIDPAPRPLGRLLPKALGDLVAEALSGAGVELLLGRTVTAFEIGKTGGGRAEAVLSDGTRVPFDRALSAIGLAANVGLARDAGLAVDQGIVVDPFLRTGDPDIFALGDCAQTGAGMLPFVLPLMAEARTLAKTLAGDPTPLRLPALPIVVKTPAIPIAICPPKPGAEGSWNVEGAGRDRRALYKQPDGTPIGFALTGAATGERQALAKIMPDLLSA